MRFECPSCAQFEFNCYRHWSKLVIRAGDGTGHFFFRKEGVTQGDPLSMVACGLIILPLIRELRQARHGVTKPLYSRLGGTFEEIRRHLDDLMVRGSPLGYFLEPTKSLLVVSPQNFLRAEAFFRGYGLHIVTGRRYIGGFVGTNLAQDSCLGGNVEVWRNLVATSAVVARRHPQTAYVGLKNSLHQEWTFVQHVTLDIGMSFHVVEDALWGVFLAYLFQGGMTHIPGRSITVVLVKQAGIALPNPTRTVGGNWTVSCVITGHLVTALRGTAKFRLFDHALLMGEGRDEKRRRHSEEVETTLGEARAAALKLDA